MGATMIDSPRYRRVCLAVSLVAVGVFVSGCTMHRQPNAQASAGAQKVKVQKVKTASAKTAVKTAKAQPVKATTAVDKTAEIVTASIAPQAPVVGRTWNYEYAGSRGTITYNADGTSSFNEPGLRKGS